MGGLIGAIESSGLVATVSKVAPLLGTILGTPLAGVGVSLLASLFGVDPKNVTALNDAIRLDPEAAAKIKKLEFDHLESLRQIASNDYAQEVTDRINARQYSIQYKDFLRHMAYLITIGFFAALLLLFYPMQIKAEERELLSMLIGMLVSKWQTIIDFFYGSSNRGFQNGKFKR